MGGCATKPKVSKDDAAEAPPEPAPENVEELILEEKKDDQETKAEAIVEGGKKEETETETETEAATVAVEEAATESNPPQESQLVVKEQKDATDEIVEQVIKEKINEEGKDSSQIDDTTTAFKAFEAATNAKDEMAQPETDLTATPTPVETVREKKPEAGKKMYKKQHWKRNPKRKLLKHRRKKRNKKQLNQSLRIIPSFHSSHP